MMVVFGHAYFPEVTIRKGPIILDGHRLCLERHEEAEFRVVCPYTHRVELAATQFPRALERGRHPRGLPRLWGGMLRGEELPGLCAWWRMITASASRTTQ